MKSETANRFNGFNFTHDEEYADWIPAFAGIDILPYFAVGKNEPDIFFIWFSISVVRFV